MAAPDDTTTVTALPGWASTPPEGVWSTTAPAGTVELETCSTTTVKPAPVSVETALSLVCPVTSGTATAAGLAVGLGPFETVTATAEPLSTFSPAAGAWPVTVPSGAELL